MRPTDVLKNEHRVIEHVLDCLERLADRCGIRGELDASSAREVIDFFQHFADRCHHAKEEQCLFPMLEAQSFPHVWGPTRVMLDEHEQGRRHLRDMAEAVEGAAAGNPLAVQRFLRNAWAYICLLRQHIQKEDQVLFPLANRVLDAAEQQKLWASFDRLEEEQEREYEKYLKIAHELANGCDPAGARPGARRMAVDAC
jgi:hemerythrin-like domain-containing protein